MNTHMPVPSPCIDVCRMNPATGLCDGCLRTIDEIAAWGGLDDAAKRALWRELRRRRMAEQGQAASLSAGGPRVPADD